MELRVDLGLDRDADPAEVDAATRQLRNELLELDVDDVQRVQKGSPPPGARAVDVAVLGSLAVTAGQEVIGAVFRALAQWLGRGANRSVKLTIGEDSIELSGASADDQRKLLESFLDRHATES